jgi:hypothetical protein
MKNPLIALLILLTTAAFAVSLLGIVLFFLTRPKKRRTSAA